MVILRLWVLVPLGVGRTFSGKSYKRFIPLALAMYFTLPRQWNWVPSDMWKYMWVVVLLRLAASIVAGTVYPTGLISECMKGLDTPLIRQGVMIASPFSRIIRFPRKRRYLFIHKHILYRNKLISRRIDNRKYTVIIWYY